MGIEITICKSETTTEERVKRCWTDALKDLSREELIDQIRHLSEENRELKDDAALTSLGLDKNEMKFVKPYTDETRKDAISILKELKRNGWKFNYISYGQKAHDISLYREFEDVTEFVHVYSYDVEGVNSKLSATKASFNFSLDDLTVFKKLMTFLDSTC